MIKIRKILSNTWVISILSPIIVAATISFFTALNKQINFFEALNLLGKKLFTWIARIITFKVPLYIIILVIIFLVIAFKVYIKIDDIKKSNLPKWLNYTKTHYKKWFLKWEYHLSYDNKYNVENLRPICKCGCELSKKDSYNNTYYTYGLMVCPKCENTYPTLEYTTLEDFEKILFHDINEGNYPQEV